MGTMLARTNRPGTGPVPCPGFPDQRAPRGMAIWAAARCASTPGRATRTHAAGRHYGWIVSGERQTRSLLGHHVEYEREIE